MGERIHQPCPCGKSSDACSYNDDKNVYYCHSCGSGGPIVKTYNLIEEEGMEMSDPYFKDYRGIPAKVFEQNGSFFTKDAQGNEILHHQYPNGVKHRTLPKSFKVSGKLDKFFGQDDYSGGRYITITEGELDRLSVIQMLG